jgi:hypothetical protein
MAVSFWVASIIIWVVFWCAITNNSWILHHDNAPANTALSVREFLASKQITVLEHPPYSSDLAPNDFFLFPKIKETFKGRKFDDIWSDMTALKAIPQNQFQNCFEGWTRRWHRCIASQGEYFEGNHSWYSAMRYVALLPWWVPELYCQTTYTHIQQTITSIFNIIFARLSSKGQESDFLNVRLSLTEDLKGLITF